MKAIRILFLVALMFCMQAMQAQVQMPSDLSKVQIEHLSDTQVLQLMKSLKAKGGKEETIKQQAVEKGMSLSQWELLVQRASSLEASEQNILEKLEDKDQETQTANLRKLEADDLRKQIYGMSLFAHEPTAFSPNLHIATPASYVLGTGDRIEIEIYGDSEASHRLQVNKEGRIAVPYVGSIGVAGMSIEDLRSRLKAELAKVYPGIHYGSTKLDVNLGEVRSVQVILAGELVQPGSYSLPATASVFNALYVAGGPTAMGDMREIKLIRKGKLVSVLDVYAFLHSGELNQSMSLQDQDIIQVSAYSKRVKLNGAVKRPLYFDLKENETFSDLIQYAGGFTDKAFKKHIQAVRYTDKDKKVLDVLESQFFQFKPQGGDEFTVAEVVDRYENRIELFGAVYKPGLYELTPGLTLSMLLNKAEGLKEDAYLDLAYIDRLKENLEVERISFNIAQVLAGVAEDIRLQKEDKVYISSIFDLRDAYKVQILGEVRNPGVYDYAEGMKIDELILQAGGLTAAASHSRIEVSRRLRITEDTPLTAETFYVDLNPDLTYKNQKVALEPFDLVVIRSDISYQSQKNVRIEGEVRHPGIYTIRNKDERISDLIERAGGLTSLAYAKGASLRRTGSFEQVQSFSRESQAELAKKQEEERTAREQAERAGELMEDISGEKTSSSKFANEHVGISLDKILKNKKAIDNIFLEDGDVLFIPKQLQTVKVGGEVLAPVTTLYQPNKNFKHYVSNAGGFGENALKRRAYVVYANGSAAGTKNFMGIKSYPKIEPGAEIHVPQKQEREPLSAQAWMGLGTSLATIAAIIFGILK